MENSGQRLTRRLAKSKADNKITKRMEKITEMYTPPAQEPVKTASASRVLADCALSQLNELPVTKQAYVPQAEIGQPAPGMPMDPAMGGGGMPMDPAMGGMPMDPAMGGMPGGGPGAGMGMGMPGGGPGMGPGAGAMDGSGLPPELAGLPPEVLEQIMAEAGGMPAAPAEGVGEEGGGEVGDRLNTLESGMNQILDLLEKLKPGELGPADAPAPGVAGEAAGVIPEVGGPEDPAQAQMAPAMPGPYGSGAADALGGLRANDMDKPQGLDRMLQMLGQQQ